MCEEVKGNPMAMEPDPMEKTTKIHLTINHGDTWGPMGAYSIDRSIVVPRMSDHAMADLMMKLNAVVEDFNAEDAPASHHLLE